MFEYLEKEFNRLGCDNAKTIALSTYVYLDLCEIKRYWDVEYSYNQNLEKIYFTAKTTKNAPSSLFIPVEVSESLSFNDLQNLLNLEDSQGKDLYIAIVHSDSTCIYYQIFNGLVEVFQEKNEALERSRRIDVELRKNRALIEQAALCNIPITLAKHPPVEPSTSSDPNNKT